MRVGRKHRGERRAAPAADVGDARVIAPVESNQRFDARERAGCHRAIEDGTRIRMLGEIREVGVSVLPIEARLARDERVERFAPSPVLLRSHRDRDVTHRERRGTPQTVGKAAGSEPSRLHFFEHPLASEEAEEPIKRRFACAHLTSDVSDVPRLALDNVRNPELCSGGKRLRAHEPEKHFGETSANCSVVRRRCQIVSRRLHLDRKAIGERRPHGGSSHLSNPPPPYPNAQEPLSARTSIVKGGCGASSSVPGAGSRSRYGTNLSILCVPMSHFVGTATSRVSFAG